MSESEKFGWLQGQGPPPETQLDLQGHDMVHNNITWIDTLELKAYS